MCGVECVEERRNKRRDTLRIEADVLPRQQRGMLEGQLV